MGSCTVRRRRQGTVRRRTVEMLPLVSWRKQPAAGWCTRASSSRLPTTGSADFLRRRKVWTPVLMLTAREYGLLQYLMRRHDQIVAKAATTWWRSTSVRCGAGLTRRSA